MTGYSYSNKSLHGGKIPLETYRIVEISHYQDFDGYYNTFKAVPREIKVPQYMNDDAVPECDEQSAVVMDNNDPQGMGRIRVRFPWQQHRGCDSPWIRVTTPYAGKGKGFHILPEIGEEVIVGFENGNAEKPFVLGAMFHAEGKSGHGGQGNFIKGLQTATGIKIVMNDQDKSVLIEDPSGNTWFMDGKGNINVNAPNDITMTAGGSISMTAGQNINSSAAMNIVETAGVDKTASVGMMNNLFVGGNSMMNVVGDVFESITGNFESHTEKERVENAKAGVSTSSEGTIEKHSQKEVQNNSGEKTKLF